MSQSVQDREKMGVSMNTEYDPNTAMKEIYSMLGEQVEQTEQPEHQEHQEPQEHTEDDDTSPSDAEESPDESEESAESEESEGSEEPQKKAASKDTEEIEITDDQGRRKITIDYTNRDSIKRAYQQAAGARKLYAKYQDLKTKFNETSSAVNSLKEKSDLFDKLDSLYTEGGYRAVVEKITGKSFGEIVREYQAEQERIARMSPEDRLRYEREQLAAQNKQVIQQLQKEKEEALATLRAEKEAAAVERMQGIFDTVFDKYRFTGQVQDKALAFRLDKLLFNHVKSELADLEESGIALTQPVIDRVMKEAAEALSFTIEKKANAKATKHIAQAKKQATKAAQTAILRSEKQIRSGFDSDVNWEDDASIARFLQASVKKGRQ